MRIYRQLAQALQAGPVVVATVGHSQGSVPREVGAKMLVTATGQTFDTIGGGAGEAKVIAQAQIVLATGEPQWVDIDLSGDRSGRPQREGVCGGRMRVWLERWAGVDAIAQVQRILTDLQAGTALTLVTPLTATSPYIVAPGSPLPSPDTALIEHISPPPLLLIIGAGHVGTALAHMADWAGFEIAVQDDRPDWANGDRLPQAGQIWTGAIAPWLEQFTHHCQLYVALVTRGYRQDCAALHILLNQPMPYAYIGMIGSRKRIRTVWQDLENQGIDPDVLQKIYAPIGLDIGALTPEEIAVSICAELIQVRRQGAVRSRG
jgi:xanthine dehydrogenase accessory factor